MNKTIDNKKLSNLMLQTGFICNLLYSTTYPYIYAQTMKQINENYISIDQIIVCISTMFFGWLWNKFGDTLFKYFNVYCVFETIVTILFMSYTIATNDLKFYYICNSIVFALITRNIICGGTRLKAKVHPTDTERERYDNRTNSIDACATLIGSTLAITLDLDISILLFIACIGNTIDNFSYHYIWKLFNNNVDNHVKE